MKLFHHFLFLLLCTIYFYCSSSGGDDSSADCIAYSIYVSDNCDCESYNCKLEFWTTKEEYERLLNILNASTETCTYVTGKNFQGNAFEGYLLELNILNIEPCLSG